MTMFKKEGSEGSPVQPRSSQDGVGARKPASNRGGGPATIGPSITIKGNVSGDEDLIVQGRIDGKVNLAKHNVTIGSNGRVKADVHGKMVVVEGEVEGDLRGQEQIILRQSAKVNGSIAAPRVTLEDGAVFRGAIEMDSSGKTEKKGLENAPAKKDAVAVKEPAKIGGERSDTDGASTGGSKKALSTSS
jgi:cytoskeletal protein CcmA (bactofilin family)